MKPLGRKTHQGMSLEEPVDMVLFVNVLFSDVPEILVHGDDDDDDGSEMPTLCFPDGMQHTSHFRFRDIRVP